MSLKRRLTVIDRKIFYFINHRLKNRWFDRMMPVITNEHYFRIPLLITLVFLLIFGTQTVRMVMVLIIIVVALSDQLCNFFKRKFGRLRPGLALPDAHRMVKAGRLSFPSAHSANNLGTALVISWFAPQIGVWFIGLSLVIGFSRVYCGVHYPLDVLVGFLVGAVFALITCLGYGYFFG